MTTNRTTEQPQFEAEQENIDLEKRRAELRRLEAQLEKLMLEMADQSLAAVNELQPLSVETEASLKQIADIEMFLNKFATKRKKKMEFILLGVLFLAGILTVLPTYLLNDLQQSYLLNLSTSFLGTAITVYIINRTWGQAQENREYMDSEIDQLKSIRLKHKTLNVLRSKERQLIDKLQRDIRALVEDGTKSIPQKNEVFDKCYAQYTKDIVLMEKIREHITLEAEATVEIWRNEHFDGPGIPNKAAVRKLMGQ